MEILRIGKNFTFERLKTEEKFDVCIPFSVIDTLFRYGIIEDPYYRDNQDYVINYLTENYRAYCYFEIEEDFLKNEKIFLSIQVDTLSDVYLNGKLILSTKNMHRVHEVEVKSLLKKGENFLEILLYSPLNYIKEKQKELPLFGVKEAISGYSHIRKAHYMFGWDWGVQLPDYGVYHPVELKGYSYGRIKEVSFSQKHFKNRVKLSFYVEVENFSSSDLSIELEILSPSGATFNYKVEVAKSKNKIDMEIDNPFLWWPNGYGKQYLYQLNIYLLCNEKRVDSFSKKFGLRDVKLIREKDSYGESFYFRINDIDIFSKGANYIPEDHIIPRINRERSFKLLSDCIKANFNTIRMWGGGFYQFDYFYEMCDNLGILVWHDFMFACSQYPPHKDFITEIKAEIIYNVNRLKFHPSIILWCGNNEIEEAWVYWGIPQNFILKRTYLKIFENIIPSILKKLDPDRPYWPSSPSSGGNFYKPREETKGDSHYWAVWHGQKPFEDYKLHNFRFVSEFGFQSFPCLKTINTFTLEEDRNIFSYVMEKHQKNQSANGKIMYYLSEYHLFPKDFRSLIYLSQILQAETIKFGVEHFRMKRGICMGAIYWQLNDSWPVASWSGIDYYGRWKALHYYAKRFYAPIIGVCNLEETLDLYIVNDIPESKNLKVLFFIRSFEGELIYSGEKIFVSEKLSSQKVLVLDYNKYLPSLMEKRSCYFEFEIYDENDNELYNGFAFFTRPKHFISKKPEISFKISEDDSNFYLSLITNRFAKSIEISFKELELFPEDNYFDLSKGKEKVVRIKKGQGITVGDVMRNIEIMSLRDCFFLKGGILL